MPDVNCLSKAVALLVAGRVLVLRQIANSLIVRLARATQHQFFPRAVPPSVVHPGRDGLRSLFPTQAALVWATLDHYEHLLRVSDLH